MRRGKSHGVFFVRMKNLQVINKIILLISGWFCIVWLPGIFWQNAMKNR